MEINITELYYILSLMDRILKEQDPNKKEQLITELSEALRKYNGKEHETEPMQEPVKMNNMNIYDKIAPDYQKYSVESNVPENILYNDEKHYKVASIKQHSFDESVEAKMNNIDIYNKITEYPKYNTDQSFPDNNTNYSFDDNSNPPASLLKNM